MFHSATALEIDANMDALSLVQRGWDHLHRQQPLAAWACWRQATLVSPEDRAATAALARLEASPALPAAATRVYRFGPPRTEERRRQWDEALRGRDLSHLARAGEAFAELAADDPDDAAAWYNLALCRAWTGENVLAVEALAVVVELLAPYDMDSAVAAWGLAEVLRQGAGAESIADDLTFLLTTARGVAPETMIPPDQVRPIELPELEAQSADAPRAFEWLDRPMPSVEGDSCLSAGELPVVLASVVVRGEVVRYSTPLRDHIDEIEAQLLKQISEDESESWERATSVLPLSLLDAAVFTFRLPRGLSEEASRALTREAIEHYFEDIWIHEPRQGLDPGSGTRLTPLGASRRAAKGDLAMGARLAAVIEVREQLAERPSVVSLYAGYPFDRLRRRLGLVPDDPDIVDPNELACMSREELEALDPAGLDAVRLREATRSARGLAAFRLASRFAEALVERDPGALLRVDPPWLVRVLAEGALVGSEPNPAKARGWIERGIALCRAPGATSTVMEDVLEALWEELAGTGV